MNAETRGQIVTHPVDGTGGGERRRCPYVGEPMEGIRRLVCNGIFHGMDPGCGAWSPAPFVCPEVSLYTDQVDGALRGAIHRNLTCDDAYSMTRHEGEMGIRISLGSYRLFHESGTEWMMTRSRGREEEKMLEDRARQREEERVRRLGAMIQ